MTTLVANLPPTKVWVRREYLRDLRDGEGDILLVIGLHVSLLQVEHYILKPISQSMGRCLTSYLSVLFFPGTRSST